MSEWRDFGSPDCLPSQDRKTWWLYQGRVYAPCSNPKHAPFEGRIVWNPDAHGTPTDTSAPRSENSQTVKGQK